MNIKKLAAATTLAVAALAAPFARAAADGDNEPRDRTVRRRHVEWLKEFRRVPRASAKRARLEENGEGSVAQFGQHLHLARETRNGCIVCPMENLERRRPRALRLDRSVDLAGAAARDKGDDAPAPNLASIRQRRSVVHWRMAFQPFLSCRFFIQHYQSQELATDH